MNSQNGNERGSSKVEILRRRPFLQSVVAGAGGFALGARWSQPGHARQSNNPDIEGWKMAGRDAKNSGSAPTAAGPSTLGEKWRFETEFEIQSSPIASDGLVYIGSEDRHLYALNQDTGEVEWKEKFGETIERGVPAILDDKIILAPRGADGREIHALDKETGEKLWKQETTAGARGPITAVDGAVYYGDSGGMIKLDADSGEQRWEYFIEVVTSMRSGPAVVDGAVYFGTTTEEVYALDAETGDELWNFSPFDAVWSDPTVVGETVYVGSDDENVYALDANDGSEYWSTDMGERVRTSPAVHGETVFIAAAGTVTALDSEDGSEVWSEEIGRGIRSSPAVTNSVLYVGGRDSLYALDIETGEKRSVFQTEDRIRWSSPAIVDDIVFIGSTDNSLYAISEVNFDVSIADVPDEVVVGDTIDIEFEVLNTASASGVQNIRFQVDSETEDVIPEIELEPDEIHEGTFSYQAIEDDQPKISLTIETDNDREEVDVGVATAAFFDVTITDTPDLAEVGEEITVVFEVTNTGDVTTAQDLLVLVGGNEETVLEFELDGGEMVEESIQLTPIERDMSEIEITVRSNDDEESVRVDVLEEGRDDDRPNDSPADDTDTADSDHDYEVDDSTPHDMGQENDSADGLGPGFNVGGALTGIGGVAYLIKRRLNEK